MNKPLLAVVSQRVDILHDRGERRDALDQALCQWISLIGCLPVPVPNRLIDNNDLAISLRHWLDALMPSVIVLSGGNDIGEIAERDLTECHLLDYAAFNNLPVLGICRGMQMMAVWGGASLKSVNGHVRTRHQLRGELTSEVNSFHNYSLDEYPSDFEVLAWSEDGIIEAIRHKSLPWEGWMWHPERENVFLAEHLDRGKRLFYAR